MRLLVFCLRTRKRNWGQSEAHQEGCCERKGNGEEAEPDVDAPTEQYNTLVHLAQVIFSEFLLQGPIPRWAPSHLPQGTQPKPGRRTSARSSSVDADSASMRMRDSLLKALRESRCCGERARVAEPEGEGDGGIALRGEGMEGEEEAGCGSEDVEVTGMRAGRRWGEVASTRRWRSGRMTLRWDKMVWNGMVGGARPDEARDDWTRRLRRMPSRRESLSQRRRPCF